jgi:hypothetical protein
MLTSKINQPYNKRLQHDPQEAVAIMQFLLLVPYNYQEELAKGNIDYELYYCTTHMISECIENYSLQVA